ncbi:bis(5'-nucleosyl)-tetraphosphatase (symmetrical) YqeK [Spirochaetia bacterium 38H-sp]|uniref:bis(5'-nucleosyl)-tetraphosphatase (symmetrical) n=1 Tax=Rarispira pelagica TaxID=3141764 RepID=A0ABU9UE05_9SPIR
MNTLVKKDYTTLIRHLPEVHSYIKANLSEKRYLHSLRVARVSAFLCRREGLPAISGHLAGLSHDMARELSDELILDYAGRIGYKRDDTYDSVVLLHGMAGRYILAKMFGVVDEDVLSAVEHHTLGHPKLTLLGKIVFCADYIEPGRDYISFEKYNSFISMPLNDMVVSVVDDCRKRGYKIHPITQMMIDNIVFLREACVDQKG